MNYGVTTRRVLQSVTSAAMVVCAMSGCRELSARDPSRGAAMSCSVRVVTPARALRTADGLRVYVETPQIVRDRTITWLVGSPTFALTSNGSLHVDSTGPAKRVLFAGAALGRDGTARLIPTPSGVDRLGTARAMIDPDGHLNVLWLPVDSLNKALTNDSVVLFSRRIGERWDTPRPVDGRISPARWESLELSQPFVVDKRPTILVGAASAGPPNDVLVSWSQNGWGARPVPFSDIFYINFASLNDDRTQLIASVNHGAPDGNAVFVRRSVDHGATWLPPERVSRPGTGAANYVRMFRLAAHRVVIVWAAQSGTAPDSIRVATSQDDGQHWQQDSALPVDGDLVNFDATATEDGVLHLLLQEAPKQGTPRPRYVAWSGGAWTQVWTAPGETVSLGTPSINSIDAHSTLAVWSQELTLAGRTGVVTMTLGAQSVCKP